MFERKDHSHPEGGTVRRVVKSTVVWMMILISCMLLGVLPVYASSDRTISPEDWVGKTTAANPRITLENASGGDKTRIRDICEKINEAIHEEGFLSSYDFLEYRSDPVDDDIVIIVNMQAYRKMKVKINGKSRWRIMQIALSEIDSSSISSINRTKIYDELSALDQYASLRIGLLGREKSDFSEAYKMFQPFTGFFGWVLGMITLMMFSVLGLTIAFDISYINLPFMQDILSRVPRADGRPHFVSSEACNAVREADSKAGEEYVNPNGIYIQHKGRQFIVVFLCILYLCSGRIYEFIGVCMDYFRGISA